MEVHLGVRVVRGPDWEWGDQDGGEGHVGTVVEVGEPSVGDGGRAVVVQWDCGEKCRYRCGHRQKYDLRVLDTAPAGVIPRSFMDCDGCVSIGISGSVWVCCCCQDCILCSKCYFSDEHLIEHQFIRRDTAHLRCRVKQREGCRKVECKGLFPGAQVQRYDSTPFSPVYGLIESIKDHSDSVPRSIAVVKWEATMSKSECKVGCDGTVELKCSRPASNGFYYPDHLAVLGMPLNDDEMTKDIIAGDYVRVELDVEVFKMMQTEEHGGWHDAMALLVGKVGRVRCIRDSGDLCIMYNGHNSALVLNPDVVAKVNVQEFIQGDVVRIMEDKEKALKLQREFGILWLEEMNDTTNQVGVVEGRDENGNVCVSVKGKTYLYSPFCIEWIQSCQACDVKGGGDDSPELLAKVHQLLEQSNPDVLAYAARLEDDNYIKEYLASCPNEVNRTVDGMAPIHYSAKFGKINTVKTLLEYHADVDVTDEYSRTPLHYCAEFCPNKYSQELCQLLLGAGADPNQKNIVGETPLIKAINCRNYRSILGLINSEKTDVHIEDLEGQTPLHLAISEGQEIVVKMLISAGADPTRVNHKLESPLHLAATSGFAGAVKVMVEHHPECMDAKDENGCTALHIAVLSNNFTTVTMLLKQPSCDIDVKTNLDRTPLHAAVLAGYTYLVEQLVGYGADLNIRDHEGCTALHVLLFLDISGITVSFEPLSDKTPELQKVKQLMQSEDVDIRTLISCFFILEGADMSQLGLLGLSSSQTLALSGAVNAPLMSKVKEFTEKFAGSGRYHGSLRQKGTSNVAGNRGVDGDSFLYSSELTSPPNKVHTDTKSICELCEEEVIDVRFLPCEHAVICSICARRATKCIKCKKPITGKKKII